MLFDGTDAFVFTIILPIVFVVIQWEHSYCTPLKTKYDILLKEHTDIQVDLVCLDAV